MGSKESSGEEIPITSENLHELISRIPQEHFDRSRRKLEKLWEERERIEES